MPMEEFQEAEQGECVSNLKWYHLCGNVTQKQHVLIEEFEEEEEEQREYNKVSKAAGAPG